MSLSYLGMLLSLVSAPTSRLTSSANVFPRANRRPKASTNPSYRSRPFACAATWAVSGRGGVLVSEKRTKRASASRGGPGNSDRVISYSCLHERRDVMGKVTRKRYGADFKAKVALDAIKGEQTLAELAAKHGIHQTMIAAWKRQAIEGLTSTFSDKAEAVQANSEAELSRLHAKIGQLVVERDFLAKASGR